MSLLHLHGGPSLFPPRRYNRASLVSSIAEKQHLLFTIVSFSLLSSTFRSVFPLTRLRLSRRLRRKTKAVVQWNPDPNWLLITLIPYIFICPLMLSFRNCQPSQGATRGFRCSLVFPSVTTASMCLADSEETKSLKDMEKRIHSFIH